MTCCSCQREIDEATVTIVDARDVAWHYCIDCRAGAHVTLDRVLQHRSINRVHVVIDLHSHEDCDCHEDDNDDDIDLGLEEAYAKARAAGFDFGSPTI